MSLIKFESMLKTNNVYFFDLVEFEEIIIHYIDAGKHSLAKKAVKLGLEQHPQSVDLKLLRVELYIFENELDKASLLLKRVERLEPSNDEVFIQDKGYISGEEDEEFDSDFESLLINPRRIGRDVNHTHSDIDTSESENDTSDSENDTSESENDMSESENRVILNQDGSPYMIGTDEQESDDDSIIGRDGDIGFRRDCYFWGNDDELYYIDNSGIVYLEEDTGIDRELKFNRKILYESDNIIYDTIVDVKRLLFIDSDDEREYRDYEGVIENYTRIMSIKVGYITIEIDIIINTINIDILDELQKNLLNDFKDIVKVSYEFNEVSAYYTSPVEHSYGLDRVMKLEMNVKEHRDNIFRVCEYLLMYVRD